jgi:hypothetical protein
MVARSQLTAKMIQVPYSCSERRVNVQHVHWFQKLVTFLPGDELSDGEPPTTVTRARVLSRAWCVNAVR